MALAEPRDTLADMSIVPLGQRTRDALRRGLLGLFDAQARDLPWRRTDDAYAIWVSEIMLQQTRVETAIPYYERWLDRFPTIDALAAAPLDDVLESWAGLGYYSRARNLHKAAQVVRESWGSTVPESVADLRSLPGVGEYTAGAVASIAHGIPAPAVDGNVRRVLSRLFDIGAPTAAVLRTLATALVDPERPGDWNQALMEFGATVCTPRAPRCEQCPVSEQCMALAADTVQLRPPKKSKKDVPTAEYAVSVVIYDDGGGPSTLLRRRPPNGLLGGMLEFPSLPVTSRDEAVESARSMTRELTGEDSAGQRLDAVAHRFSHLAATYHPSVWELGSASPPRMLAIEEATQRSDDSGATLLQVAWAELSDAALSAAQKRIAAAAEAATQSRRTT